MGRAIGAVWMAMGISMFLLMMSLGDRAARYETHVFVAIIGAMLGMANATSSMILKWKMQFACAVVWWATTVDCVLWTETQSSIAFLVAIFLCQIVFGIYAMICESRQAAGCEGAAHA